MTAVQNYRKRNAFVMQVRCFLNVYTKTQPKGCSKTKCVKRKNQKGMTVSL